MKKLNLQKLFTILMISLMLGSLTNLVSAQLVTNGPDLQVYFLGQDPDPAERGDYVTLRWKVDNIASTAEDVEFQLVPQYPFALDPGNDGTQRVGDIWRFNGEEERSLIIKYKVRVDDSAEEGDNEIALRWRVKDSSWIERQYEVEVEEAPDVNLQIGDITTSPIDLVADNDDNLINIQIQNVGEDAAEYVIVNADLPFEISFVGAERENLGNIAGGSATTASFYYDLDEDVEAGWYNGTLFIEYKEEGDQDNRPYLKTDLPFHIYVKPTPLFKVVNVETIPENPVSGDHVIMTVTLENYGSEKGESVSLRAFKDSTQPWDYDEKSDFIGTLEPNEKGEANIEFTLDDDATPKEYRIDIETSTIDGENVIVDSKTITFNVNANNGFNFMNLVYVILIIAIIIGLLITFKPKKRK